jgi:hypothetical protein
MNIKINIIETASKLAENEMKKHYLDDYEIYKDENDYIIYTDKAQELFNNLYDEHFDLLYNLQETVSIVIG